MEVVAAAYREHWAKCLAHDAACLPFGVVGELRRKPGPIVAVGLGLFMGVLGLKNGFSGLRQSFPAHSLLSNM